MRRILGCSLAGAFGLVAAAVGAGDWDFISSGVLTDESLAAASAGTGQLMTRRGEVAGNLAETLENLPRPEEPAVLQPHVVDHRKSGLGQWLIFGPPL